MANLLKPFVINSTDIQFILDQLNFRPLFDAAGNAVINWDGTGSVYDSHGTLIGTGGALATDQASIDAIVAFGSSYQSVTDLAGLRDVTGLNNNLALVNNAYGAVDQIFTRTAAADYANYSPILQAVAEQAYAAAKQYYSTYAYAPIYADASHTTAVSNWDGTGTVYQFDGTAITGGSIAGDPAALAALSTYGGGNGGFKAGATDYKITNVADGIHTASDGSGITINNIVDYTPRMISLTTTTAGVTYDTWANHTAEIVIDTQGNPNHTTNEIYYDAQGVATVLNWGQLETVANGGLGQVDTQARLSGSAGQDDHFIGGLNPGVSPSNGFFVLFGQFFDHGLDFIDKGGQGATIKIALAADDPLYGQLGPDGRPVHEITINRATVQTVDANGPEYVNHTSPFIDQSQTYGSHEQLTTLLREWVRDPADGGNFHAGMSLFDGKTLATQWTKADGTPTNETLPTLNELQAHIIATGRDALTWDDVSNLRNRDASGHVIAGTSGSALILDMNPRFDAAHLYASNGFNDANHNGTLDVNETSYAGFIDSNQNGTLDVNEKTQVQVVDDAIATLNADVQAAYGPGVSLAMVGGVLTLTGLPGAGPAPLTGASALYPWVNFSNFSIMQRHPFVPGDISAVARSAVSDILLASVGDHYIAGDGRVNENFGLTSIHHIFHEEHNYQVQNLIDALHTQDIVTNDVNHDKLHEFQVNTGNGMDLDGNYVNAVGAITWDLDKLFNGAKLIVEMEYQHAAVDQYARNVTPNIQEFVGYSPDKNPAVSLEYAQAAFRFGHSTLRETIDTIDPTHGLTGKIMGYALKEAFLSPEKYQDIGPAAVLLGMSHQQMNEVDEFVTPALNQGLLGQPLDLAAINIARGRDIGLPTLNDFRAAIGLLKYTSWNDFGQNMQHPSSLVNFIAAYAFDGDMAKAEKIIGLVDGTVTGTQAEVDQAYAFLNGDDVAGGAGTLAFNNIDTWLGGLAEIHQPGGLLGETFDKVFVNQIESLMDGDRFYYLFRLAGQQFAEEVGNGQLKDIVERNTGLVHLNGNIFGYADQYVDLGAHKEVLAPGQTEYLTTGNEHKWGDIAAVDAGTIGVYSNGGRGNLNDGHTVKIGGVNYIQDTRLAADVLMSGYNNPLSPNYNPAYAQNGFANLDGTPNSGAESNEVIVGSKGNDLLYAQGGDDTVYGDGGNDIIYGGFGIDRLYGGDGADTLYGGDNPDLMDGGSGDDVLHGDSSGSDINGNDQVIGGSGNDTVYGDTGIDKLSGGTGDDKIYGGQDTDPFTHGSDGNDYVAGDSGGDILYGDNGSDILSGGADQDQLFGGNGDDILRPGDPTGALTIGTDEVLGGDGVTDEGSTPGTTGFDIVDFSDNTVRPGGVAFDLSNQQNPAVNVNGIPKQIATFQIEGVIGSGGGDGIIGDDGDNWLVGGSGNDTITAGSGNDVIIGGHIRLDTLIGRYESAPGVASTYDHNNNNDGSTDALRLQDAQYQGASHRVGLTDTLSAGLLDNAALGTTEFAKHFNEMLRSDQFKNTVLGDGGVDGAADTVVYSGNRADYTVSLVQFASLSEGLINAVKISGIAGTAGAADGTDLLAGIERLQFADAPNGITLANFFNVAPVITSAAVNAAFAENTAQAVVQAQNGQTLAGTVIAQLTASDVLTAGQIAFGGSATPLSWSIANTAALPANLFAIDNTGKLTFASAPNFEALRAAAASINAAGTELTFNVQVKISDGDLASTQTEVIRITNVDEASTGGAAIAYAVNAGNTSVALTASNTIADLDLVTALNPTGAANPNVTYQWQYSSNGGGSWNNLAGAAATTANLTPSNAINNSIGNPLHVVATYTDAFGPHSINSNAVEVGNANGNTLAGTAGADVLIGLGGSDTYTVNNAGDVVVEAVNAGTETVQTTLTSYALGANVENLTYTGAAAFTGTGNAAANTIAGGAANDILTGGLGNDTLNGGGGIDTAVISAAYGPATFAVNNGNVQVTTADGTDTLISIEKLQFSNATVSLQVGTNNSETLVATTAPELFFGRGGTDTVSYVNSAVGVNASLATGTATNGDRFNSIENLTGSNVADTLTGDGNANVLTGGAGADVLNGGGGTDTAVFSGSLALATFGLSGGNLVVTTAVDGTDTLNSIETIQFDTSSYHLSYGSNNADNPLNGTTGNDLMIGFAGSDTANGGDGDDTFIATTGDGNDVYSGGNGTDTYDMSRTSANTTVNIAGPIGYAYSLDTVTGTPGFPNFAFDNLSSIEDVIGSTGANNITGSSGVNVLSGMGGNDILTGGGGDDTLIGGAGNDTMYGTGGNVVFMFASGFGNDAINDFDANPGGGGQDLLDVTALMGGVHTAANFNAHVSLSSAGNDTLVTIGADTITIKGVALANVNINDFHY